MMRVLLSLALFGSCSAFQMAAPASARPAATSLGAAPGAGIGGDLTGKVSARLKSNANL